jgi:pyrrolidone-carboxylate peptidase
MTASQILVTAFEPFGGDAVNPSLLIARQLDGVAVAGARVVAVELPCVFHQALSTLDEALARTRPVLAVALGLAGTGVRSGFIHVPLLPEQAERYPGKPVLALAEQVRGVRLALQVALTHQGADLRLAGGAVA